MPLCLHRRHGPGGLDAYPAIYEAKILIMEMTFVAPGHRTEKIHKFGHMHLDDFVERRRPVQERADHRLPLQHPLPRQAGPALREEVASPTCSAAGCICGCNNRRSSDQADSPFRSPFSAYVSHRRDCWPGLLRRLVSVGSAHRLRLPVQRRRRCLHARHLVDLHLFMRTGCAFRSRPPLLSLKAPFCATAVLCR